MAEADTATLRGMLADQLLNGGLVRSREVAEAFREVPRHLFVPEAEPVKAYADEELQEEFLPPSARARTSR